MGNQQHIAVVGAGVMGLTQALLLKRAGHQITLFEQANEQLDHHCSSVAAGMIAPYCELSDAEAEITQWGEQSLQHWKALIPTLQSPVHATFSGTIVVSHHQDRPGMHHLAERVKHAGFGEHMRWLRRQDLRDLEPELEGRFGDSLFFEPEGEVAPRDLLPALVQTLRAEGATLHFASPVEVLEDGALMHQDERHQYDWVIDCRGLAAQKTFPTLRGIRGEVLLLRTPEVELHHPIRMMHPRYPLYIVPRPDHHFFLGATSIESDAMRKPTVKSALELLSAAYSLHPAFAEAEIIEMKAHLRPCLADHLPAIRQQGRTLHVNGLHRHGYLLTPYLAHSVCHFLQHATWPADAQKIHQTRHV
ncbi:MAG: glycine oxidase ThiO [Myxococcales bacterium]|nr:glycine oxidase ThiO [Myxococcales bacterium]